MPSAFDNGVRSPKRLLRRLVRRLVSDPAPDRAATDVAGTPETHEPRPDMSRYADAMMVVLRYGDDRLDYPPVYENALSVRLDVGGELDLESLPEQIARWMGKRNALFELRTSRTRHEVGASGMSAGLVVTVIASGITQIALEELWRYIKSLLPESAVPWTPVEWLRQLDEDELAQALQSQIASALDRRRSELTLVQLLRDKNEISAVFDADDDTRYVIRATETLYLIRHVSNPARPRASPKPGGA